MLLQVILEGIGLGVLLILVCAIGICKGAVGMVHLYSQEVQERCVTLGLTTHAKIKRNALIFKAVCVPGYIAYVLVCVYCLLYTSRLINRMILQGRVSVSTGTLFSY